MLCFWGILGLHFIFWQFNIVWRIFSLFCQNIQVSSQQWTQLIAWLEQHWLHFLFVQIQRATPELRNYWDYHWATQVGWYWCRLWLVFKGERQGMVGCSCLQFHNCLCTKSTARVPCQKHKCHDILKTDTAGKMLGSGRVYVAANLEI